MAVYDNCINILPASTKYEVVVDVRGQSWSQDMLDDIFLVLLKELMERLQFHL